MFLLYRRLSEARVQIERLAARFEAGTLRRGKERVAGLVADAVSPVDRVRPPGEKRARQARIWPGRFGWLCRLVTWEAGQHGALLRHALLQPEMQALLVAAPQAGRILLPVCRMLAIEASLLRPGIPVKAVAPREAAAKRVRRKAAPLDWGRIPLPRGLLAAAKKQGYGRRRDYFRKEE